MRILRPLARRPVALLWGGLAMSAIGDQVYIVAIAWIGVLAFGPRAGWLNALGSACALVTVLFSGPWVDRFRPAAAMVAADGVRALVLLLVVGAWVAGLPPVVWASLLVLAVAVLGAGQGVFRPALQDVMPATVADPALLPAANALFDSTERIARLLGPGLIGVLSAALSPVWFLLLDALTFVVSGLCVRRVGAGLPRAATPRVRLPAGEALLLGFRTTMRHRVLGWQLLTVGPNNGTWMVVYYLAVPLMVERHGLTLGGGASGGGFGAYGLVLLGYGVTNLLGNLVVGNRDMPVRPARQIAVGNFLMGVGMAGIGFTEWLPLAPGERLASYVGLAAVSALSGPLQDIPVGVLRQTDLARSDVPAAMRAYMSASQGGMLVALSVAPLLLSVVSAGTLVAGCGVLTVLLAVRTFTRDAPPRPVAA